MRVKYKPKPKIPAGSVPRERETTPSAELRKEAITATGEQTTTPSPANETSSRTKELRTSQEPSIIPVTPTSCTSTVSTSAVICSVETADTVSNSYSTSATILTELGISPITSSRTRCDVLSDLETSHLAADTIRTSSSDYLNVTSSAVSDNDRQSSSIYCHSGTSEQLNSSPSFGEGFPCAVQAESIPILCDDDSVMNAEDTSIDSNRTIILQPSSSQYPSFIESLSSSVLNQVASSHRVLGLDHPSNGELVTGNAVETTYKRRFCEDSDVDEDDEEMDVFDNCPDDRSATGSSNSSHLLQVSIIVCIP